MSENERRELDTDGMSSSDAAQSVRTEDFEGLFDDGGGADIPMTSTSQSLMDPCPHPGYMSDMCIRCGAEKPKNGGGNSEFLPFGYIHRNLEFSKDEAKRVSSVLASEAETRKKLQLVLDLDHTLLHSAPMEYALSLPCVQEWLIAEEHIRQENSSWKRLLHPVHACFSVTKLRPGVFAFLNALRPLYDMHIYTMGEETYACEMAKLLDPDGSLFQKKVISREHSLTPVSKNLDIVMGSEHSTLIVDDTWQVWTQHRSNLILISKYFFFLPSAHDSPNQNSWLNIKADENPQNNDLAQIHSILVEIHSEYFNLPQADRDVRQILRRHLERRNRWRDF